MKKILALALALVMLLVMVACSKNEPAPTTPDDAQQTVENATEETKSNDTEPVTITWAVRESDNYPMSLYDEMAENFMKVNNDIIVEVVPQGPLGTENEWLKAQLAAGTLPDVLIDANVLAETSGALLEMPENIRDLFLEGTLAATDGKYSMIPATTQYRMQCYYNKAYFAEAGVEIPKTWDEFVAACEKLTQAGYTPLIAPGTADAWACSYIFWASNCNSDLIDAYPDFNRELLDGTIKWNNPRHVESLTRWKEDLIDKGYYFEGSSSLSYAQACQEFDTGRAAMMLDGSWRAAGYDANGVTDFGCFEMPNISGAQTYCTLGHYWGVSAQTKNPEAAWRFIDFVLGGDEDTYRLYLEADGVFPVTKKEIQISAGPCLTEFMNNLKGLTLIPEIPYVYGDDALPTNTFDVISEEIYGFFSGAQTAEQALDNLDAELAF